eukprot:CAMPEP_0113882180 /NCGR_PEP_ID=MMETSP0780_2-20120614/8798_1 /TAXON_ID=652834 /ORGANISM="Palpitomonas bilix" /LENGTH=513 /DNA_ID=CAMNT_0000869139 /DNA_START=103 /DNA_END=1644 /DNA_ORIENTATION=+ /assembly_acc=CAM_ASM_000599
MEAFAESDSLLGGQRPIVYWTAILATVNFIAMFLWFSLGWGTRREAKKIVENAKKSTSETTTSEKNNLPCVTSIQAVKGIHAQSLKNWHSQVASFYKGERECIFVVESEQDPAYEAVQQFRQELISRGNTTVVRIVVAGVSFHCSQKLHNMLFGVASASANSKYVLFMDDDAAFYPSTIETLVMELENNPTALLATGHPFAFVPRNASIWSYCRFFLEQMKLLGAVFPSAPGHAVWGGCMMLRLDDLRSNNHGIIDAWHQHGYSDDMIAGGISAEHSRDVRHPMSGFFANELPKNMTFYQYWNQMYRQMFVLSTYRTTSEWFLNHLLLAFPSFVLPILAWVPTVYSTFLVFKIAIDLAMGNPIAGSSLFIIAGTIASWVFILAAVYYLNAGFDIMCSKLASVETFNALKYLNPFKLVLAATLNLIFMTIAAVVSFATTEVDWAGIKYWKKCGKVVKVIRPDGSTMCAQASYIESRDKFQQYLKTDPLRYPIRNLDTDQVAHVYVEKRELLNHD